MHEDVRAHFDLLCRRHPTTGTVLEIGAMASPDTLLTLPSLARSAEKIGLNMDPQPDMAGVRMVTGNANAMHMIGSSSIDLVLCNSVLEHDRAFWRSLDEMRRVLKPGGLLMLGVPGYAVARGLRRRTAAALSRLWPRPLPGARWLAGSAASTATLNVHNYPSDYFRFGPDAMRDVLFTGMDVLSIDQVMAPPRYVGVARRR